MERLLDVDERSTCIVKLSSPETSPPSCGPLSVANANSVSLCQQGRTPNLLLIDAK